MIRYQTPIPPLRSGLNQSAKIIIVANIAHQKPKIGIQHYNIDTCQSMKIAQDLLQTWLIVQNQSNPLPFAFIIPFAFNFVNCIFSREKIMLFFKNIFH